MLKQINIILVPIDFSDHTDVAISKALDFCQQEEQRFTIHLFHVQRIVFNTFLHFIASAITGYTRKQINLDIKRSNQRLNELKNRIESRRKGVSVHCRVSFGDTVQDSIIKKAKQISADLIVIGKSSHHTLFTFLNAVVPSKLAAITGIPVLTAKPGSLHQEVKTVVIPVGNHFPSSKLEMLAAFRGRSRPHIRLVIFAGDGIESGDTKELLLYTFRAFKSQFANPVNYEVLEGGNKARALLKYCDRVGADVLIVYPGIETHVGGWTNSHISDLLPAGSKTQILAVRPA